MNFKTEAYFGSDFGQMSGRCLPSLGGRQAGRQASRQRRQAARQAGQLFGRAMIARVSTNSTKVQGSAYASRARRNGSVREEALLRRCTLLWTTRPFAEGTRHRRIFGMTGAQRHCHLNGGIIQSGMIDRRMIDRRAIDRRTATLPSRGSVDHQPLVCESRNCHQRSAA